MQQPKRLRIAVVNDYELVVAGIASVLSEHSDRVEVVELDAQMPVISEVDVVLYDSFGQVQGSRIDVAGLMTNLHAKLVVFSWNTETAIVEDSLRAGADAYLSKGLTGEGLVDALERVHAGERITPFTVEMSEGDDFGRWPGSEHGLSPRESEVMALICQGLSNQEVAARAFLGVNTVKTYIRTLYRKIDVDSRTKAVLWGIEHGFMPDRVRHLG
jgi:NarL family two-component system response regulator LiaR